MLPSLLSWLRQGTTIQGLGVLSSAATGYLSGTVTGQQAATAAVGAVVLIAMKQHTGTTVIQGGMPMVSADTVALNVEAGANATIQGNIHP